MWYNRTTPWEQLTVPFPKYQRGKDCCLTHRKYFPHLTRYHVFIFSLPPIHGFFLNGLSHFIITLKAPWHILRICPAFPCQTHCNGSLCTSADTDPFTVFDFPLWAKKMNINKKQFVGDRWQSYTSLSALTICPNSIFRAVPPPISIWFWHLQCLLSHTSNPKSLARPLAHWLHPHSHRPQSQAVWFSELALKCVIPETNNGFPSSWECLCFSNHVGELMNQGQQ